MAGDLPANLKPSAPVAQPLICLSRSEAEQAQIAILENQSCHDQLSTASGRADWVGVVLIGAGALIAGFVIGQATK